MDLGSGPRQWTQALGKLGKAAPQGSEAGARSLGTDRSARRAHDQAAQRREWTPRPWSRAIRYVRLWIPAGKGLLAGERHPVIRPDTSGAKAKPAHGVVPRASTAVDRRPTRRCSRRGPGSGADHPRRRWWLRRATDDRRRRDAELPADRPDP